ESPEFYRLRMDDNRIINISIDSIEKIRVNAPYEGFSTNYQVEGSRNCSKIKELTLLQIRLQDKIDTLRSMVNANHMKSNVFEDSLSVLLRQFKNDVRINYIYAAPNTTAAYYALFQKLDNYLIFDPLNSKDDVKCFAAVATSLTNAYPNADRSKNLYNIAIKGMKNTREVRRDTIKIPESKISETGVIDIALRDVKEKLHHLTDFKGQVVLIDFTVYQSAYGAAHNLMLRDLYSRYASKGLQIYQVSLDADEHFWKTSAYNLPWICVRDGNGIHSTTVSLYNVNQVPLDFLVNRNNELRFRIDNPKTLEGKIKGLI
ncbi:MAG: thioredoxin-like domain-containing protein, partial [Bacteroidaceae bacterium]